MVDVSYFFFFFYWYRDIVELNEIESFWTEMGMWHIGFHVVVEDVIWYYWYRDIVEPNEEPSLIETSGKVFLVSGRLDPA